MEVHWTCFWLLLILLLNLIDSAVSQQSNIIGNKSTDNATDNIDTPLPVALLQRPDAILEIPSSLRKVIETPISEQPIVNETNNATDNTDLTLPVTLIKSPETSISKVPSGLHTSLESALSQQTNTNGINNATESSEISPPIAAADNPNTVISINSLKSKYLDSEILPRARRSVEPAVQDLNINGTYNATESVEISPPAALEQKTDLDSDIPSGPNRSSELSILEQSIVNGTYNATESIEDSSSVISAKSNESAELIITLTPKYLEMEELTRSRRSLEADIEQPPNVNGTYNVTKSIEDSSSVISAKSNETAELIITLTPKYLEMEELTRSRRSLEEDKEQPPNVNGTYNVTKSIEDSSFVISAKSNESAELIITLTPKYLEMEELIRSRRSPEADIEQPSNVNGTYNVTKSIEDSSSVISAKSNESDELIITLTPKYLEMTELTRSRRSPGADAEQPPNVNINVNGSDSATDNIEISPPVASGQLPDTVVSEITSGLSRSFVPVEVQQLTVNETYNTTESTEVSTPVVSAVSPDTPSLVILLIPKYLDMEQLSRPRRSLDSDILQPLSVNGTYNATENIAISPSVTLIQSPDTSKATVPSGLSRSFEPALLRQPNVNGTYNTTEIIEISSPIVSTTSPDSPTLVNSLKSKYIDPNILPALRKYLDREPTENNVNLNSTQQLEMYLQPVPKNITNDVSEVDDLPEYLPISLKNVPTKKVRSGPEDLRKTENLSVVPILRNQTSNWRELKEMVNTINSNQDILKISSPVLSYPSITPRAEWPFTNPYTVHIPRQFNQTERIMVLAPRKEQESSWNANAVHSRLEEMNLKEWTEDYVLHLHRKYEHMPIIDADNRLWSKYSRAVVENFVLAFCRAYIRHKSFPHEQIVEYYEERSYNKSYNSALNHLRKRKGQTALQFAAQPRRYSDILLAIIDTPIDIVQSYCRPGLASWMCNTKYLTHLMDESENCSSIWLHATVHLDVIEANDQKNPADIIVDELESRITSQPSNEADLLFDFIINTIDELRSQLKQSLIISAKLYRDVKDLQEKDLLQCLKIH